jgi:transposase-like protein
MESITTEVVSAERTRDAKGRRLYTVQRKEELLREYEASGLTQWGFAKREGINYTTFVTWVQRAKKAGRALRFQELVLPRAAVAGKSALVVTMPDGVKLSGADAQQLAALVRLLRA